MSVFTSSKGIERKFCSKCGSNVEWKSKIEYPDYVEIAAALFDDELDVDSIPHIHEESRTAWCPTG